MRSDKEKLEKILECIERIISYTQRGEHHFLEDSMTQDAVVRNFQIIGDAVKDLSEELRTKYSDIDWSEWARSRDKVTHDYFGVDYEKVWVGIEMKLPAFRKEICQIYEQIISRGPEVREYHSKLEELLRSKRPDRRVTA